MLTARRPRFGNLGGPQTYAVRLSMNDRLIVHKTHRFLDTMGWFSSALIEHALPVPRIRDKICAKCPEQEALTSPKYLKGVLIVCRSL
jgi:hypothetical protein